MAADLFTEDGAAMYADSEPAEGREAIAAGLEARMAEGSSLPSTWTTGQCNCTTGRSGPDAGDHGVSER